MFDKAIELMLEGKIVSHKGVQYAMIGGALNFVVLTQDHEHYRHRQPLDIPFNELLARFEDFNPHAADLFPQPKDYVSFVVEDSKLFDFTVMPQGFCPRCNFEIKRSNVILEGRYAHCPGCQHRFFRAPRIDRSRDASGFDIQELPLKLMKKPKEAKEKKEKPKPPTNEELIAQAEAEGNVYRKKISF